MHIFENLVSRIWTNKQIDRAQFSMHFYNKITFNGFYWNFISKAILSYSNF